MPQLSVSPTAQQQPAAASKYRIETKSIFYTWPQCDTDKEIVLSRMIPFWQKYGIEFIIVCQEKHKDGNLHLHALSVCENKRSCTTARWADHFAGKHGDYVTARGIKKSVEYIQKKGDWVVYPPNYDFAKRWREAFPNGHKRKVGDQVATHLREGGNWKQLVLTSEHSGFVMLNFRKIEEYESALKRAKAAESALASKEAWRYVDVLPSMSSSEQLIVQWMNKNLGGISRTLGEAQLYVHGTTGVGKTHLVQKLRTFFRVYDVCMNEDWMDDYCDEDYDLVVMEEFKGQKQITWMNQFLDGQPCPLRRRGKSAYLKTKNLPVIILSNWSLERAYKNSSEEKLAPLLRRLFVVDTTLDHSSERPINIFG